MTQEEANEILNIEIPYEALETIYRNVEENINKIIKNPAINYKQKVEINYRNPWNVNTKYPYNAYAGKIIGYDFKYEIYICPLLIKDLFKFAHFIAGYKYFKLSAKEEDRQIFAQHLMYLWLYFISLHEYAHIVLGHVDCDTSKKTIYEYIDIKSLNHDELIECQAMELEADSLAAELYCSSIIAIREYTNRFFTSSMPKNDYLFDYTLGLYFLFHFLDLIPKNKNALRTHPLGTERGMFCNGSILSQSKKLSQKLNLSEDEFELINSLSLIQYLQYIGLDKENILLETVKFLGKMKIFDEKKIRNRYKDYKLL